MRKSKAFYSAPGAAAGRPHDPDTQARGAGKKDVAPDIRRTSSNSSEKNRKTTQCADVPNESVVKRKGPESSKSKISVSSSGSRNDMQERPPWGSPVGSRAPPPPAPRRASAPPRRDRRPDPSTPDRGDTEAAKKEAKDTPKKPPVDKPSTKHPSKSAGVPIRTTGSRNKLVRELRNDAHKVRESLPKQKAETFKKDPQKDTTENLVQKISEMLQIMGEENPTTSTEITAAGNDGNNEKSESRASDVDKSIKCKENAIVHSRVESIERQEQALNTNIRQTDVKNKQQIAKKETKKAETSLQTEMSVESVPALRELASRATSTAPAPPPAPSPRLVDAAAGAPSPRALHAHRPALHQLRAFNAADSHVEGGIGDAFTKMAGTMRSALQKLDARSDDGAFGDAKNVNEGAKDQKHQHVKEKTSLLGYVSSPLVSMWNIIRGLVAPGPGESGGQREQPAAGPSRGHTATDRPSVDIEAELFTIDGDTDDEASDYKGNRIKAVYKVLDT